MENRTRVCRRLSEVDAVRSHLSQSQKSRQESKQTIKFPIAEELRLKFNRKYLDHPYIYPSQRTDDSLTAVGELRVTGDDNIPTQQAVEHSIIKAKNELQENSAEIQEKIRKLSIRSIATPITQSLHLHLSETKSTENARKKSRPVTSTQRVLSNVETRSATTNAVFPKVGKSKSYQNRSSESPVSKDNARTPIAFKSERNDSKTTVTTVIKKRSGNPVKPINSLKTISMVASRPTSPTRKGKIKLHVLKKSPNSKQKLIGSDTEISEKGKIVDNESDPERPLSQKKSGKSFKKRSSKSGIKLKASSSEFNPKRDIQATRTVSTPRLRGHKQRQPSQPISNTGIGEYATPSPPRSNVSSKVQTSKLQKATKRSSSSLKTQESKLSITSKKTKSASKLQDMAPQSTLSIRLKTFMKEKRSSQKQTLTTATKSDLKTTDKGTTNKDTTLSANKLFDANLHSKTLKAKLEKLKPSFNANGNNINELDEKAKPQADQVKTLICMALPPTGAAAITESNSSDEILQQAETVISTELKNIKSRSIVSFKIDATSLKKKRPKDYEHSTNNNSIFPSRLASYEGSEQLTKQSGLYNTYFLNLIDSDSDDENCSSISFASHSKGSRHKVRFNLQSSEIIPAEPKSERVRLGRTWSGCELKKDENHLLDSMRFFNKPQGSHKPRKLARSPGFALPLAERTPVSWSNIWPTFLKSKKWRALHPSLNSTPRHNHEDQDNTTKQNELTSKPSFADDLSNDQEKLIIQAKEAESQYSKEGHSDSCKIRKSRSGIRKIQPRIECVPEDVVYPPYTLMNDNNFNSNPEARRVVSCQFVQSEMAELDESKNTSNESDVTAAFGIAPCLCRKTSTAQTKWNHMVECVTKQVKQECHAKGYEFLQKLSRGNPRVRSILFLANNKKNALYTPVEVTAIRLPDAFCTSSSSFTGETDQSGSHQTQPWITSLPPHKNLMMLLHCFCTPNWVYNVTQHCTWPSLNQLINHSPKKMPSTGFRGLREKDCKTIFRQICTGIEHLHQHNVVHGDLNCSNVLVSDSLQVKLTGYGPLCQRMVSPPQKAKLYVNIHGDSYSACTPPEIMARKDCWTESCDVWCMGITLLEMSIGEIPQEVNLAIRLGGSSNIIARLRLPICGYQRSRLIDKILQPIAVNRPSVANITNHAWLSDGTDLAAIISETTKRGGTRRTDGSTFPLPKRLQCQDSPPNTELPSVQSRSDEIYTNPTRNEEIGQENCFQHSRTLGKINLAPSVSDNSYYGRWLSARNCQQSMQASMMSFSSTSFRTDPASISTNPTSFRTDLASFRTDPAPIRTDTTSFTPEPASFSNDPASFRTDPFSFRTDPAPIRTDTTAFRADLDSISTDPASFRTDPFSFRNHPDSFRTDPTSIRTDTTTFRIDPTSFRTDPVSCRTDPTFVITDPAPFRIDLAPFRTDPAPFRTDPASIRTDPSSLISDQAFFLPLRSRSTTFDSFSPKGGQFCPESYQHGLGMPDMLPDLRDLERPHNSQTFRQHVLSESNRETHKGCDLLKLMENITMLEENAVTSA